jgi:hypothetical protein
MPQVFYVQNIASSSIFQIDPSGSSIKLSKEGPETEFQEELKIILLLAANLNDNPSALVKGGYVQVPEEDFTDRLKAYKEFKKRQSLINR